MFNIFSTVLDCIISCHPEMFTQAQVTISSCEWQVVWKFPSFLVISGSLVLNSEFFDILWFMLMLSILQVAFLWCPQARFWQTSVGLVCHVSSLASVWDTSKLDTEIMYPPVNEHRPWQSSGLEDEFPLKNGWFSLLFGVELLIYQNKNHMETY